MLRLLIGVAALGCLAAGQYFYFAKNQLAYLGVLTAAGIVLLLVVPSRRARTADDGSAGTPPESAPAGARFSIESLVPPPPPAPAARWSAAALIASAVLLIGASGALGGLIGMRLNARPTLSFKPEHDFGKAMQGKILERVFAFTNTGDKELVIQELRTS